MERDAPIRYVRTAECQSAPVTNRQAGVKPDRPLADYATDATASRGRLHAETESPTRTEFQRDRDRVVHSAAFRRLSHKTQVFVYHEGDHYRTRLTHSIEVSQIARALARSLRLDEDLAEAIALAHDLGHPPFGHAGERALDRVMEPFGGFDHNAQSLAVVTRLENRYAAYDGLNLTWEALEGLVKHNGPFEAKDAADVAILDYSARHDLELHTHAGPEAQCAAIADDIAYNSHDIDDGLRAGLFGIDDVAAAVPMIGRMVDEVRLRYPGIEPPRLQHETVRRVITRLIEDVLAETSDRLTASAPRSAADIRAANRPLGAFSAGMTREVAALREFLFLRMYRHSRVMRIMGSAEEVVERLFERFMDAPAMLPAEWRDEAAGGARARAVADYIAGMTDRFALAEHRRLFDDAPELR